ncbi:hypothetical protein TWF694_009147 [Orbilia ellipsospora]|uniref:CUE domain-containing protein n=1 Tax=Orbilia ellipsospora TaxID=2528407 RepID=A0AAV9XGT2_9PEZI
MGEGQIFFAAVPPSKPRSKLPPAVVSRCLTLWSSNLQTLISLPDPTFKSNLTSKTNPSLANFIQSYILHDDILSTDPDEWLYPSLSSKSKEAIHIKHSIYTLLKRATELGCIASILPPGRTVIKLAALFFAEGGSRTLLRLLHTRSEPTIRESIQAQLKAISASLSELADGKSTDKEEDTVLLQELSYFLMTCPEVADQVLSEEVLFENLALAYHHLKPSSGGNENDTALLEEIRRLAFTAIIACTQSNPPKLSQTVDFLFNLTSSAESSAQKAYLTAIVSETPLLARLTAVEAAGSLKNRWSTILQKLGKFESSTGSSNGKRISRLPRRKPRLKKSPPNENETVHHLHELKELFPDTDAGVLAAILESVNNDFEAATVALLDQQTLSPSHPPPPPQDDELDMLSAPMSRLYMGKRDLGGTADALLANRSAAPSKQQILAALQAFDSDDDERDDTYDLDDVGGAVDTQIADTEANAVAVGAAGESDERVLFSALVANAGVFARDAVTRRSEERKKLRETTGMSDEAIEGWKIMLDRDGGKRLRQLEIRFAREQAVAGAGEQAAIARTAYRKGDEEGDTDGEAPRGQHRGGRRFAGPNDRVIRGDQRDHAPVVSEGKDGPRIVKKTSKARGEHNRKVQSAARDRQRTKKMAKGM